MTVASECYPAGMPAPFAPSGAAERSNPGGYLACKGAADFLLSILLFVVTLPLMILGMALMKLTSAGPAIYSQRRVGLRGRVFTIYKIRTMVQDSERLSGPRWSIPGDPRITPVGRFLRWSHIDELPQLVNVLRGEMSLIGPRPERPEIVEQLDGVIPLYRDRLLVRPGVTGLAQIQLPPDVDFASVRRKQACDLYYVQRVSPWLDLQILLGTLTGVLGVPFAVPCTILRIPSGWIIEQLYRDLTAGADPTPPSQPDQPALVAEQASR